MKCDYFLYGISILTGLQLNENKFKLSWISSFAPKKNFGLLIF